MDKRNKYSKEYTEMIKQIGLACRDYRIYELRIPQNKFAKMYGISQSIISLFESGRVDSLTILMCYMYEGFEPYYDVYDVHKTPVDYFKKIRAEIEEKELKNKEDLYRDNIRNKKSIK